VRLTAKQAPHRPDTDTAGNESSLSGPLAITIDTTPPVVLSAQFDRDTAAHSIRFHFSADVSGSLSAASLVLTRSDGGATPPAAVSGAVYVYDNTTNTAVFTFPAQARGQLPDGWYTATLSGGIVDTAGNAVAMGTAPLLSFGQLAADFNLDNQVDRADLSRLLANLNKSASGWADGDLNGDRVVNFVDYQLFERAFGHRLTPPPAPPAPSAPSASLASQRATAAAATCPVFSVSRISVAARPARPKDRFEF
jgi:hypothetical protein